MPTSGFVVRGEAPIRRHLRILALAQDPWDGRWLNRQQLLSRLAREHDVVYSTGAWSIWDRGDPAFRRSRLFGTFDRTDAVWVDRPPRALLRYPPWPAYDALIRAIATRRWWRKLTHMGRGALIAYVFHPEYLPYVAAIRPDYVVYHAHDLYALTPGWTETHARQQAILCESADLVIASSSVIGAEMERESNREVRVLPNGADYRAFELAGRMEAPVPSELARIPRPRIGYVGTLNLKVDFVLVAELARRRPDWHLVLMGHLGKLDDRTSEGLRVCRQTRNVHILAARDHTEMPARVAALDVALMCYRREDGWWSRGGYPLKLHEYLASGRPVVSSDLPTLVEFEDVVAICTDPDSWEEAIAQALRGHGRGTVEERRAAAAKHDWNLLAQRLSGWLVEMTTESPGPGEHHARRA